MARKTTKSPASKTTTAVRNTAIPRAAKPAGATKTASKASEAPKSMAQITNEMIARRAYEIYISGQGGGQLDHWLQAERELKAA